MARPTYRLDLSDPDRPRIAVLPFDPGAIGLSDPPGMEFGAAKEELIRLARERRDHWAAVLRIAKALRNQARLETPLDADLVETYATAMKAGDQFPPLVLWRAGRGRYIPIDGNQRLAAKFKCEHATTDAYIVKTADQMIADRLTWSFNNLVNGKRISQEEALQHAVAFVRKYGLSQAAAAKEWGIPEARVRNACRSADLRDKLESQGVKRSAEMTDDRLLRIAPLEKLGDDVLALGAAAVIENGLTHEQCQEMTKRAAAAKTHDAKLQAVAEYTLSEEVKVRKAETKGGHTNPKVLPRERLVSQMMAMLRLLEDYPAATMRHPVKSKFAEARQAALEIVTHLTPIFGLGAMPKEDAV